MQQVKIILQIFQEIIRLTDEKIIHYAIVLRGIIANLVFLFIILYFF